MIYTHEHLIEKQLINIDASYGGSFIDCDIGPLPKDRLALMGSVFTDCRFADTLEFITEDRCYGCGFIRCSFGCA